MNMDDILKAMGVLDGIPKPERFPWDRLFGMPVIEIPPMMVPKIQVSKDFEWLTDEDREKINNKLIELFGYRDDSYLKKGEAYMLGSRFMAIRSEDVNALRNITA